MSLPHPYLGGFFAAIGLSLAIGGAVSGYNTLTFLKTAEHTTGVVKDLASSQRKGNTLYSPVVTFVVDQKNYQFTSSISSSNPSYAVDDPVKVVFDPQNPHRARIDTFFQVWSTAVFLVPFGLIFFAVGASMLNQIRRRHRRDALLAERGTTITATLPRVETAFDNVETNGVKKTIYTIVCQTTDPTGAIRIFKSDSLEYNPTPYIADKTEINVIVDPQDWSTYKVDLSSFPVVK